MRESENFRDELEQLYAFFPNKRILNPSDVSRYTGKDRRWCKKTYEITGNGISVVALAKKLSQKEA